MNPSPLENNEPSASRKTRQAVFWIALLGVLLLTAAPVLLVLLYPRPLPLDQARIDLRKKTLAELSTASAKLLNTYGWQDQAKGIVRVPVTHAMELVEQEWRNPVAARSNLIARAELVAGMTTAVSGPSAEISPRDGTGNLRGLGRPGPE
jgi:hypothetical protein